MNTVIQGYRLPCKKSFIAAYVCSDIYYNTFIFGFVKKDKKCVKITSDLTLITLTSFFLLLEFVDEHR